jgi:N-acetylmuramoyl-L-alanine amidase
VRICAAIRRACAFAALAAALLSASLSSSAGPLTPVKLRVGGKEIALNVSPLFDGREVYLPLEALRALGGSAVLTRREESALVTFPNAQTVEIALARPGREPMLPLSAMAGLLKADILVRDGICDVRRPGDPARDRETPGAKESPKVVVSRQSSEKEGVTGNSSFILHPSSFPGNQTVQRAETPDGNGKKTATVGEPSVKQRRTESEPTRPSPNVLPDVQKNNTSTPTVSPSGGTGIQRAENPDKPTGKPSESASPAGVPSVPAGGPSRNANPTPAPVRIKDVTFEPVNSGHVRVHIQTDGRATAAASLLRDPSRLAVDVPNSALDGENKDWKIEHPFLSGIHATNGETPGTTRFVLDLQRLVSYRVVPDGANGVIVNLGLPRGAGRKMSDLLVVVDPGHGGPQKWGCYYKAQGVCILEKDLTLSIARRVRKHLEEAGARVLMTRDGDEDIGLSARPRLANENGADLFISIHIDDVPIPNSASGTTTYYHMDDPSSRALAHSIVERIAQVSGLPNRRARSDGVLYASGLAVLRYSQVPAALVEVGYINNRIDRAKLVDADFQETVAEAIVDGIRGYIESALPEAPLDSTGTN